MKSEPDEKLVLEYNASVKGNAAEHMDVNKMKADATLKEKAFQHLLQIFDESKENEQLSLLLMGPGVCTIMMQKFVKEHAPAGAEPITAVVVPVNKQIEIPLSAIVDLQAHRANLLSRIATNDLMTAATVKKEIMARLQVYFVCKSHSTGKSGVGPVNDARYDPTYDANVDILSFRGMPKTSEEAAMSKVQASVEIQQHEPGVSTLYHWGKVVDEKVAAHLPAWAVAPLGESRGLKLFLDGTSVVNVMKEDFCAAFFIKPGDAPKSDKELRRIAEKEEKEKAKQAEKEKQQKEEIDAAGGAQPPAKKAKTQTVITKKRFEPATVITHKLRSKPVNLEIKMANAEAVTYTYYMPYLVTLPSFAIVGGDPDDPSVATPPTPSLDKPVICARHWCDDFDKNLRANHTVDKKATNPKLAFHML